MNSDMHQPSGLVLDVYRTSRYGDCTNGGVSATHGDLLLVGTLDECRTFATEVDVLPAEYAPHRARRHFLDGEGPARPTVALQIRARSFFARELRRTGPSRMGRRGQSLPPHTLVGDVRRQLRRHLRLSTPRARRSLPSLSGEHPSRP
ncbi:hypothetical protein [Rhodococcus artemisiae]|uniref:Uncharacterized protein n=1 Tax=Rhodococcus artemisiae TaxID=714159 RepID=A0ABU7LKC1_9NOCA|nr:hypothetical protein [Rhodococcus artemisiae]MEE2061694.1 hypothetical protein [Rhodococcus artemisiae]